MRLWIFSLLVSSLPWHQANTENGSVSWKSDGCLIGSMLIDCQRPLHDRPQASWTTYDWPDYRCASNDLSDPILDGYDDGMQSRHHQNPCYAEQRRWCCHIRPVSELSTKRTQHPITVYIKRVKGTHHARLRILQDQCYHSWRWWGMLWDARSAVRT